MALAKTDLEDEGDAFVGTIVCTVKFEDNCTLDSDIQFYEKEVDDAFESEIHDVKDMVINSSHCNQTDQVHKKSEEKQYSRKTHSNSRLKGEKNMKNRVGSKSSETCEAISKSSDNPLNRCVYCGKMRERFRRPKKKTVDNHGSQYKCQTCIKQNIKLRKAMVKNNSGPFKCDLCDKVFKLKKYLSNHGKIHRRAMPYKCDKCDKAFKSLRNLLLHKRTITHIRSGEYKCDLCDIGFHMKSLLVSHSLSHGYFICDKCDKTFVSELSLAEHSAAHN